jgi:hypothetical protein
MLQSRADCIKPENYIATWRSVLAKPLRLPDSKIRLEVSTSFRAPIPKSSLEAVRESLAAGGFGDRIDEIASGKAEVSLKADTALLDAIYGEKGPLGLWRVLDVHACSSLMVDEDLKLPAASASSIDRMPEVQCYAIGDENRLVSLDGRPWDQAGWQYEAVGRFITDVAYPLEMVAPGFAKRAIPVFRDALSGAKALPAETVIEVVRLPEGLEEHCGRLADNLASDLGLADEEGRAPAQFSFRYGDIPADPRDMLRYRLCALRSQQVTWSVPDQRNAVDAVQPGADIDLTQLVLELI